MIETLDSQFFAKNRKQVYDFLPNESALILFSGKSPRRSKDQHYPFTINRNFYYLTGLDKENMIFFMYKSESVSQEILFLEKPDPFIEKWTGRKLQMTDAKLRSSIDSFQYIETFEPFISRQFSNKPIEFLYLDLEHMNWADTPYSLSQIFANEMFKKHPGIQIKNIYHKLAQFRLVKDEMEVNKIRHALAITKLGIEKMMASARTGMMEFELQAEFDYVLTSNGIKEHAFPSIIAGGDRATVLHYEENQHKINAHDLVLADLGASYGYYSADITRTFPISGKFTARQKTLYQIVLNAELETIAAIQPGRTFKELNEVAKQSLTNSLKQIGLIQKDEEIETYYYHSVSHSLGLDTHDVGDPEIPIQAGYVITVEPGLYLAEEGIGIRIEDDILVTKTGCEILSKDIIKSIDEIEQFMATKTLSN